MERPRLAAKAPRHPKLRRGHRPCASSARGSLRWGFCPQLTDTLRDAIHALKLQQFARVEPRRLRRAPEIRATGTQMPRPSVSRAGAIARLRSSESTALREDGARTLGGREEEEWAASWRTRTRPAGSSTRAPPRRSFFRPSDHSSSVPERVSAPERVAGASLAILESSASSAMTSRGRSSTKRRPPWNCSTRYSWNCTKRLSAVVGA